MGRLARAFALQSSVIPKLVKRLDGHSTHSSFMSTMKRKRIVTKQADDADSTIMVDPPPLPSDASSVSLVSEMSDSFMRYALSTILGRALPDARDGLKPVHRRILYGMRELGLQPRSQYRKCARVVGEVLGKYHPHSDTSVYEALVRMAQDFVMSEQLIDGHGNFGSVDADPPAAMRYTECRLTAFAFETLLNTADLGGSDEALSVPLYDNFDGSEREPRVLPARVPVLLVNGATGIAVGMKTAIPPHNLGEVCDAALVAANAKRRSTTFADEDLIAKLPAPDFPTGGTIVGLNGVARMYATGQGTIVVRAKTHFEQSGRRNCIIATELPYQVTKADLLAKTAQLVDAKKLEGISDLRDESGRDGLRVVYELKRDANPELVRNALFKLTNLQSTFSANLVAVGSGAMSSDDDDTWTARNPSRLSLRACLMGWLEFRFTCVRHRARYNEAKKSRRLHVVEGLREARQRADELIALVRNASSAGEAKQLLAAPSWNFTEVQADAVLRLQLSRLTKLEADKLDDEARDLSVELASLRRVLDVDAAVYECIIDELKAIKANFAKPRRTQIDDDESAAALKDEDVIANSRSAVLVARAGYIKRVPLGEFSAQSRGGRGKAALAHSANTLEHVVSCRDHDVLLCLASTGVAYAMRALQIPPAGRLARGSPLPQVLPGLPEDGTLSGVVSLASVDDSTAPTKKRFLVLLTRKGLLKKTPLDAFSDLSARGLIAIDLNEDDHVGWAKLCGERDHVLIATASGQVIRFPAADVKPTSRRTRGTRAIKLRAPDDAIVSMDVYDSSKHEEFLVLTELGYGKRVPVENLKMQRRGGLGLTAIKFKTPNDRLAGLCCCAPSDELVISTIRGVIVRLKADGIPVQRRSATGVLVQRPQGSGNANEPSGDESDDEDTEESPEATQLPVEDKVSQISVVPPDLVQDNETTT